MRTSARTLLVSLGAIVAMCGVVHADGIEVKYEVKPPPPPNDKEPDPVPTIEATIVGGAPKPSADAFSLIDKTSKVPLEIKGSSKKDWLQGNEKIAIAIVLNGWETWIGNDKVVPENDPTYRKGILIDLEAALDQLNFKEAAPAGSVGMVVTYGDEAKPRVPMGPLSNITGQALGTQKDYYGKAGNELVKGIEFAWAELHKTPASRKVMIVIGDGFDSSGESKRAALQELKKKAEADGIKTFAIIYKCADSKESNDISLMTKQLSTVTTAENVKTSIKAILDALNDRQYVTFKGWDREKNVGLEWDGKPHNLVVKIDKDETDEQPVVLAPIWEPNPKKFPWLIVILSSVGGLLLLFIIIKIATRKKDPAPLPVPMPQPVGVAPVVAPAAEPPKPAGPMKTVMIGVGGDESGFPVVGWLVPLNGPNAYQTMRLRTGGTKIGTAPPADLVINDGFMSTEHCQIQCTPQGYILVDGGSTNGSYVNDKRVQKHELVDNDTITLGKTNFKFKSIV